jgi:Mrp family chromosome partitioning ATPase
LMVIESDSTSYRACQKVKNQLERSGCKILGAVLNKVSSKGRSSYYSRYGRYYGAYYGNKEERY